MNYATESFSDFASRVGPTDLALYAGAALVLFVLFKDRMSPVQQLVSDLVNKAKNLIGNTKASASVIPLPDVKLPQTTSLPSAQEDVFFKLVVSWKQTRDLASQLNCSEAVKVADQMFPYLSPNSCEEKTKL